MRYLDVPLWRREHPPLPSAKVRVVFQFLFFSKPSNRRYRGAAPIQHALINGDSETGLSLFVINLSPPLLSPIGVCIMGLSENVFDQGHVLARKAVPIPEVSQH